MLFYYYYYYYIYITKNIYIYIFFLYGPASDCHPLPRRDGDGPYLYMDICKITQVCDSMCVSTCVCIYLGSPLITLCFWVICKSPFLGVRLILFGVVSRKKGLLSSKQVLAIYTIDYIGITKLNHVSVLCLSCLILDQAPSHIIQTQAHN